MTVTQTLNNSYMAGDHTTTTLPPPLQFGIIVTTSIFITPAHCWQSTNFSNGPHICLSWHCIAYGAC